MDKDNLILILYFLTGFFGDLILQISTHYGMGGNTGWGLNDYFKLHGNFESLCIAGGMLTLFFLIYKYVLNLKINIFYIAIYAVFLDLAFRLLRLFHSLDGYYSYFDYIGSAIWAIIPMLIPILLYMIIKRKSINEFLEM